MNDEGKYTIDVTLCYKEVSKLNTKHQLNRLNKETLDLLANALCTPNKDRTPFDFCWVDYYKRCK